MKNYQKNARIMNMQLVSMFDHFKMGEQWQRCIWLNLNLNLEFEFAIQLQYTSIKMNFPQTSTLHIMDNLIMCLCIYFRCFPPLLMIVPVTEFPRRSSPPKHKLDKPLYRQQGKQTPLIMSIKSHFPLNLAYECLGDNHVNLYRIVEPIPMHDLSFFS